MKTPEWKPPITPLRFAGFCLGIVAAISTIDLLATGWHGWAEFGRDMTGNSALSFSIGGLCWLSLPVLAQSARYWHPLHRWSVLVVTMVGAAAGGTGVGTMIARSLGVGSSAEDLYFSTFRLALPMTLIVGTGVTLLESSRARLASTELELQTQRAERERAEKLAAEAQFASLTSRVHPHFLFNTLNSIATLIRGDPRQAEATLVRLGALLRSSLESVETLPLADEVKLVTDYLEIQRTRMGDRLQYEIEWIPESVDRATVPPFAIQTLVENALKHVAGERQQGVTLQVSVHEAPGELIVEVVDDGPGFSPESLKSGHGLDNLQQRLVMVYGENARLEFDRQPDGMTVRLRVPTP